MPDRRVSVNQLDGELNLQLNTSSPLRPAYLVSKPNISLSWLSKGSKTFHRVNRWTLVQKEGQNLSWYGESVSIKVAERLMREIESGGNLELEGI